MEIVGKTIAPSIWEVVSLEELSDELLDELEELADELDDEIDELEDELTELLEDALSLEALSLLDVSLLLVSLESTLLSLLDDSSTLDKDGEELLHALKMTATTGNNHLILFKIDPFDNLVNFNKY
jgi:sugar-specific transcriptional regulator TrmB